MRTTDPQRRRDDLLEALFWLDGEGIERAVRAETLAPLVGVDAAVVTEDLQTLVSLQWVRALDDARFELTESGRREGGRRFADSFADVLGRQGHGACDDDCDCHDSASAAAECHTSRAHRH